MPLGTKHAVPLLHLLVPQEFNTSNENYSEQKKRLHADGPGRGLDASSGSGDPEEPNVPLGSFADNDVLSLDALRATGKVRIIEGKATFIEHAISESGDWYCG